MMFGVAIHRWLPLANAAVVMGLVAIGFGRAKWRAPIGGFALGTAAYLLAALVTGYVAPPLGKLLGIGWLVVNAFVCLWVARIALDRKTAE
jgi:serine protease